MVVMTMAGAPVMMMVYERQLAAGSGGCLLHHRRRGRREGKAYCRDRGDNDMPDAHKILPLSNEGQPPRSEDKG